MNIRHYISHYRKLLALGIPIVLGQLGIVIMGFADTLMIGRHSTEELAASAFVNTIFTLMLIFGTGFASGITPVVGAMSGRGDNEGVGATVRNSLVSNMLLSVAVVAVMAMIYPFLDCMGQPCELIPYAEPYYLLQLVSIPFIYLFSTYKQFAEGITDSRTGMWILIGGNVLNIIGNYALIYGAWGFPEMGLTGAGVSTLVSRVVMFVVFAVIFHHTPKYRAYKEGFDHSRTTFSGVKRLYALGMPLAVQLTLESSAWSLSAIMIGWLGAAELAGYQITVTLGNIGYMAYVGMGAAVAVQVSRYNGRGDVANVRTTVAAGAHLLLLQALFVSLLLYALRDIVPLWFTQDIAVIEVVEMLMIPLIVYQFADAIQINYSNALRGLADVRALMFISLGAFYCLALPAAYLCGFVLHGGVVGVWMGFPVGLFTVAALFRWRFAVCLRRSKQAKTTLE